MAKKLKRKRSRRILKTNLYQLIKSNRISLFLGISIMIILLLAINIITGNNKTPAENISQTLKSEKPLALTTAKKQADKPKSEEISYQVKKNDSLARIAKNFCNDKSAWKLLAEKNNLTSPYIIHEGETLTIACQE